MERAPGRKHSAKAMRSLVAASTKPTKSPAHWAMSLIGKSHHCFGRRIRVSRSRFGDCLRHCNNNRRASLIIAF
jgi:hypothetical protein